MGALGGSPVIPSSGKASTIRLDFSRNEDGDLVIVKATVVYKVANKLELPPVRSAGCEPVIAILS